MCKVVTVMNMKGGVGKTTIAANLSGLLSRYQIRDKNWKVLVIDYDPQFNLSQAFIPADKYFELEDQKKTILSVLVEDHKNINPFCLQVPGNANPPDVDELAYNLHSYKDGRKLDIIPSTLQLMYLALGNIDNTMHIIEERFEKFISQCRSKYDVIIIDCHPAGSLFTKTSLSNSDHVVIPVAPQPYAVRGIGLMLQFLKAKKIGNQGPKPHILFNLTNRNGISKEEAEIRENPRFSKYCMTSRVSYYGVLKDPMGGKGFVWHSKKPYSTEAFTKLMTVTRELVDKIHE